jgi:hypothetical protein
MKNLDPFGVEMNLSAFLAPSLGQNRIPFFITLPMLLHDAPISFVFVQAGTFLYWEKQTAHQAKSLVSQEFMAIESGDL